MTCVPSLAPSTLIFCLSFIPSTPTIRPSRSLHRSPFLSLLHSYLLLSPSSPHFTASLSDYADLSEPPHKKDWVF